MEKRTCAAILLLVLGIVEVYSFSLENHSTTPELSRKGSADDEQHLPSLQVMPLGHDDHGRIKRDDRQRMSSMQSNKKASLVEAIGNVRERTIRRDTIADMVQNRRATPAQLTAIVDSYMREYAMNRGQATERFRTDHPTLANTFLPRPRK